MINDQSGWITAPPSWSNGRIRSLQTAWRIAVINVIRKTYKEICWLHNADDYNDVSEWCNYIILLWIIMLIMLITLITLIAQVMVYVYIYMCIYIHMYIYIYVCIYMYIYKQNLNVDTYFDSSYSVHKWFRELLCSSDVLVIII